MRQEPAWKAHARRLRATRSLREVAEFLTRYYGRTFTKDAVHRACKGLPATKSAPIDEGSEKLSGRQRGNLTTDLTVGPEEQKPSARRWLRANDGEIQQLISEKDALAHAISLDADSKELQEALERDLEQRTSDDEA